MKRIIFSLGAIILATSLSAQINVGANLIIGLPTGDWNDPQTISTAFGGGIEGNYFIMDELSVGIEVGYSVFGEFEESLITVTQTPITLKAEYYFMDDEFKPFVGLGFGYYLMAINIDGDKLFDINGMGISPRIGATYEVSDMVNLVFNVNYNLLFGQTVDGDADVEDPSTSLGIGIGARFNLTD